VAHGIADVFFAILEGGTSLQAGEGLDSVVEMGVA
jgi:hypothetical protein